MNKLAIGLLLLLTFAFFIPQMASTNWGKSKMEAHLEELLGGKVSIEKLSLNWWGEQRCHRVRWTDVKSGAALTADSINIEANLMDCLKYKDKPLDVLVEGAKLSCEGNQKLFKLKKLEFSPIRALIQKGTVTFERTEINITKSTKVVTWGTIDLENNHMDMTLGLPPRILKKLFKADHLPEDYLLEIPISSKLSIRAVEKKLLSYFLKNYAMG